ncbi:MAG: AGE family epimerase/isomerase [Anaeromyxobacter sp.]|nr:AGE family epimerase/isomerase [Anaeromyxobacter sp.]
MHPARSTSRPSRLAPVAALLAALLLAACGEKAAAPDPYLFLPPPAAAVPAGLEPATWVTHLEEDLLPYWRMPEAQGTPVGNFPTYRGMDGSLQGATSRKPRMLGRQTYAYAVGYLLTGDEALLDLSRAGTTWLLAHALDPARGGWHADLDAAGAPAGDGPKYAQDMSYAVMGPAAYFFVTRDPAAEAAVLATRDLLFDPATYWDAANGRIRDGRTADLAEERAMDGGSLASWQLVAQLDPVTAFELLVQPALTDPARREQARADLRALQALLVRAFFRDGIFWGATGSIGVYGSKHTDFGHLLKAYWAVLQIDKRLADRPQAGFLAGHAAPALTRAHDATFGRWRRAPVSIDAETANGSDWWAYAEADQLAATLALHDPTWLPVVARTSTNFRADYVDRGRSAREVFPSVNAFGTWGGAATTSTAKCNDWKNGFHSTEHALVMFLLGHYLAGTPAPLHFAFPAARVAELAASATPYTFQGTVASFDDLGPLAGDPTRHKVRVWFTELR